MVKLSILFPIPAQPDVFEERFSNQFLPQAEQLPGLRRTEVTRILGAPGTTERGYYLEYEWYFDDLETLEAAMTSPAGQQLARQVETFGRDQVILFYGEVYES
jgi:uncharacterized protein (TIGR02118 family)